MRDEYIIENLWVPDVVEKIRENRLRKYDMLKEKTWWDSHQSNGDMGGGKSRKKRVGVIRGYMRKYGVH